MIAPLLRETSISLTMSYIGLKETVYWKSVFHIGKVQSYKQDQVWESILADERKEGMEADLCKQTVPDGHYIAKIISAFSKPCIWPCSEVRVESLHDHCWCCRHKAHITIRVPAESVVLSSGICWYHSKASAYCHLLALLVYNFHLG